MHDEETNQTHMLANSRFPSYVDEDESMESDISYESQFVY